MDIRGSKKGQKFPLMGTVKLDESQVGKGKLTAGVHKNGSKAFQSYMDSMKNSDYVMMTIARDNRGRTPAEADTNPYLQSLSVDGKDGGKPGVVHGIRISNMVGAQRDENGAVIKDEAGNAVLNTGKRTQMEQIFDKIPSVEVIRNSHGSFMHFAMEAPVFKSSNGRGLMMDINEMTGKEAEKGMADAHFNATLEGKRYAKAQREAAGASGKQAEMDGAGMNGPAGVEVPEEGPEVG